MKSLVTTQWLADELGAADLVVLDCTVFLTMGEKGFISESGRENWAAGHIPGTRFADLTEHLVDAESPLGYAVPKPQEFADAMASLGVSDTSRVVVYDDNMSMWAARVWWMLRWIGFDEAAILDGGLKAWKAEGRSLSTDVPAAQAGSLTATVRPEIIATKAEVLASVGDGETCLIDALPPASFNGEVNIYGRPGHIPGATNSAATSLIDTDSGRYLPLEVLQAKFPERTDGRVINYCGGGIAASSTAFVQTLLGFTDVAVYTASLQEWVADPDAPMSTTA